MHEPSHCSLYQAWQVVIRSDLSRRLGQGCHGRAGGLLDSNTVSGGAAPVGRWAVIVGDTNPLRVFSVFLVDWVCVPVPPPSAWFLSANNDTMYSADDDEEMR